MRYALRGIIFAVSVLVVIGTYVFFSAGNGGVSVVVDLTRGGHSRGEIIRETLASYGIPSRGAAGKDVRPPSYAHYSRTGDGGSETAAIVLLAAVVTALILSAMMNIFLFRWRREVGNNQTSVVPTVLLETLDGQRKKLEKLSGWISDYTQEVGKRGTATQKQIAELMDAFLDLQTALDEKEKEINRLKQGYDAKIFRKFLMRFIRVDNALAEEIDAAASGNNVDAQALGGVRDLLQDALDECGVSEFSPTIGESVREAFGIAPNPKTIAAETPEQELTIAEVIEPGFMIRTPEGSDDCIKPAKVAVYVSATGS